MFPIQETRACKYYWLFFMRSNITKIHSKAIFHEIWLNIGKTSSWNNWNNLFLSLQVPLAFCSLSGWHRRISRGQIKYRINHLIIILLPHFASTIPRMLRIHLINLPRRHSKQILRVIPHPTMINLPKDRHVLFMKIYQSRYLGWWADEGFYKKTN